MAGRAYRVLAKGKDGMKAAADLFITYTIPGAELGTKTDRCVHLLNINVGQLLSPSFSDEEHHLQAGEITCLRSLSTLV